MPGRGWRKVPADAQAQTNARRRTEVDPLTLLERTDKHYLGCGEGIIFAPRFPRWLDRPGFWDEIDVYQYQMAPLFTVTFLDVAEGPPGRELEMRQVERRWTPAELVAEYDLGGGLKAREHRSVLRGGYMVSEWMLESLDGDRRLLAVAWSAQPGEEIGLETVEATGSSLLFRRSLCDHKGSRLTVQVTLSADDAAGASAYLSEGANLDPRWEAAPFVEKWRGDPERTARVGGLSARGTLYGAVAARFDVPPGGSRRAAFLARVQPLGELEPRATGALGSLVIEHAPPPQPQASEVSPAMHEAPGLPSRQAWESYFDAVPQLFCSDPYLERYWYYRWYGLRLCGHAGGSGNYIYPGCCEGTGYFHVPIAYSAQCHARELRWLPDPARARGVILNFLAHQKDSGALHGRLYLDHLTGTDFYFADWGGAVLAVDEVHPDETFLRAVYRPLTLYADWLERERDPDEVGLYDIVDQYETGQEYMSRYMAVSDEADSETWGSRIRLKGVDTAVYAYRLQRALAAIAGRLHAFGEAAAWTATAERTGVAIRRIMWDQEVGMFSDVDPQGMRPTGVKAAVGFYPYMTDLAGAEHVQGLHRHLLSEREFWTPYPVPSTSIDDPYYSPDAEWKGKRRSCPWNGRVWPMTNSHLADALARAAIELDPALRSFAAELMSRFVRMMFHDGDPARPNCYEHYNPETGRPSLYRGFDDYQHSWVNDLMVRYVAGFRPLEGAAFVVDPFPFGLESLRLSRLPFRDRRVEIEIERERFAVRLDGSLLGESTLGTPLKLGA